MNIRAKFSIHIEKFLAIYHFQIDQFNYSNIINLNQVNKNIIFLDHGILCDGCQPTESNINIYHV